MQPQQTPGQNFNGQAPPQQPQAAMPPNPNMVPQPPQPQTAPVGSAPQNYSGIPMGNIEKEKKQALWFAVGSLAIFVVGFLIGFAGILGALLGAFAARKSKLINYNLGFILGVIGLILNAGFYLLTVLGQIK